MSCSARPFGAWRCAFAVVLALAPRSGHSGRVPDAFVLNFAVRGVEGRISVTLTANDDPESLGCEPAAAGFPVCEATLEAPLRGYRALLGWIQVVGTRSSHLHERRFEIDPLRIFEGLDTPFAFYGLHPTLFDAPSRRDRLQHLDWLAHSFLCGSPSEPMERIIDPIAAFQWGFILDAGVVQLVNAQPLPLSAWARHRTLLSTAFPSWRFLNPEDPLARQDGRKGRTAEGS